MFCCSNLFSQKIINYNSNRTFLNPVLAGDFPDPTILRDDNDYYMTHSSMYYSPGLLVLHSTDLINWEPISNALTKFTASVWAPDICKYRDMFYIYYTIPGKGAMVVYSKSPYGPWSDPIDLKLEGIDPGHVVDEAGQRWVFMNDGYRAKLSSDGLSVIPGSREKVYDGWDYPIEWETDRKNLEGIKVKKIGEYFYLLAAQGGTAGPPTCHMTIYARSKSIHGPWKNAPNNPLIRTWENSEKWWAKGHGTLIDTPEGNWWIVYHAYENRYLGMGRQTLIEPIKISEDGWLKAPTGIGIEQPIVKPIKSEHIINRLEKLNEFRIGFEWKYFKKYNSKRAKLSDDVLTLKAQGNAPHESAPLLFVPGKHNYEISAKISLDSTATAGLIFFYNDDYYVGTGISNKERIRWRKGGIVGSWKNYDKNNSIWLKMRNVGHIVTGYFSYDGENWEKETWGMDISGYHHNTLYDFISVLPGIFVFGKGEASFSEFIFAEL